ncbi:mCG147665 [Mus musculus]|nr:mCG147665 [Mus musculus]
MSQVENSPVDFHDRMWSTQALGHQTVTAAMVWKCAPTDSCVAGLVHNCGSVGQLFSGVWVMRDQWIHCLMNHLIPIIWRMGKLRRGIWLEEATRANAFEDVS